MLGDRDVPSQKMILKECEAKKRAIKEGLLEMEGP
jgi:hypothetical protein